MLEWTRECVECVEQRVREGGGVSRVCAVLEIISLKLFTFGTPRCI